MEKIYWGDIHNHNQIGYAEGSMDRSFAIAESSLDFYSFTPHGWWPDIPKNDTAVQEHHEAGFARVEAKWDQVRSYVREHNRPGSFVTFPGWEWHSLTWGDYCIYFPGDEARIYNVGSLEELKGIARSSGAVIIPHHPGYRLGWRGLDWDSLDETLSPVVEILSEHGNSLEPGGLPGMYGHSMGGIERSQSGLVQLGRGRKFGFIADSDDHFGYPGGHSLGLTAIYAESLDRDGVFDALRRRHTYAVTGDRIRIRSRANGELPGETVGLDDQMSLDIEVEGRDRLQAVEVFKNSEPWELFGGKEFISGGAPNSLSDRHRTRIEWGWDKLESQGLTLWKILVTAKNSRLSDISTEFCGGAGSVEEVNRLSVIDDGRLEIESFTSRRNTRPVSSISLDWLGPPDSSLTVTVQGSNNGAPFHRRITTRKRDLLQKDLYLSTTDKFSAPKLKLHSLIEPVELEFRRRITDSHTRQGDYYFIKVTQQNGQMAWTSPNWVAAEEKTR